MTWATDDYVAPSEGLASRAGGGWAQGFAAVSKQGFGALVKSAVSKFIRTVFV